MEIATLKSQLSILEVADRLGIEVGKHGKALCPFHDDKKPSLQFSEGKNIATCFSSRCEAGTMDIISLTEKYLQISTREAILQLKAWAGAPEPVETPSSLERIAVLTKAFRYYENGIKTSKRSKEYLQARGLVQATPNQKGIEVGFNSGSFHQKISKPLVESALKYGLIYKSSGIGHSSFGKDSLVFPLKDKENKMVSLYYRSLEEKTNAHLYLKDREGLYPGYPEPETKKLILTESIIDAASLLLCNLEEYSILSCYGTNGLNEEHLQAISSLESLEEITFIFDGDEAGKAGIEKQSKKLNTFLFTRNIRLYQVNLPEGEDVNSLYIAHQEKAAALFTHLLQEKKPITIQQKKEEVKIEIPKEEPIQKQTKTPTLNTSNPNKITYFTHAANYYVKGGLRRELDRLQVSLLIETKKAATGYGRYRTRIDLYEHRPVERLAETAGQKLGLRPDSIEQDLHALTDLLEVYREQQLSPEQEHNTPILLDTNTKNKCEAFLKAPNLIKRFNELIGKAGVVGEETNRVFLFCIAASYKMAEPLHALIQGSSGSGKTHLLVKISDLMPEDGIKRFTRVTESSFYNYGKEELKHKLICLEDLDGMKEEAQLAFRELQSRGMLSSSTSGQDEKGNIRAYERIVYGPIASLSCTTKGAIYEDNMSRCFLIAVDETSVQTDRIIAYQNQKASGKINEKAEQEAQDFLRHCIHLLKPYPVVNPYASKVQLPQAAHKIRRLNGLYQSFVKQITIMNQYRRKKDREGRLITEKEDLQVAAQIMFDSIVLKVDELDGSLRLFYEQLKRYVQSKGGSAENYSFGQREVRQALKVSKTQLQRYVKDLLSLEYIQVSGGHINKGYRYKIVYWDDVSKLKAGVKRHLQGQLDQLELHGVHETITQKTTLNQLNASF